MTKESGVKNALRLILAHKDQKSLNYAVNYARMGLQLSGEGLRIQVLYILNNMQKWHGEVAKEVRKTLKEYAGVK